MNRISYILSIVILSLLGACKTQYDTMPEIDGDVKPISVSKLQSRAKGSFITYDWIMSKGKINIVTPSQSFNADYTYAAKRDSMIVISIRMLGFEGARAKIDATGITVLNRLERTYSIIEWKALNMAPNYVDLFSVSQDFLAGNTLPLLQGEQQLDAIAGTYRLSTENASYLEHLDYHPKVYRPLFHAVWDKRSDRSIKLSYGQFNLTEDQQWLPLLRKVMVTNHGEAYEVLMTAREVTLNQPKKLTFAIPNGYRKVDLL